MKLIHEPNISCSRIIYESTARQGMNKHLAILIISSLLLLRPVHGGPEEVRDQTGIDEKLDQYVPSDLRFSDEHGNTLSSADLFRQPVILLLIYYNCRHICPALVSGLVESLNAINLESGKDFSVLTVSFDETDTPAMALHTKNNYMVSSKKGFRTESWKFLTGDRKNIRRLTEAVGFRFRKEREGFIHPSSLIILAPGGKITRYLYGTSFLPRDLSMAVYEASEGRSGKSVGKLLRYCFSYDPEGRTYVFNILKVAGTATILFAITFIIYLNISNRSFRNKRASNGN